MLLMIDNYDSFTYNLVQAIGSLGQEVVVARNDRITPQALLALKPTALILSPGPGRPENAGNMPEIVALTVGKLPILGICLGHQMLAQRFGGRIVTAERIVHGKATKIQHDDKTIFHDLPNPFAAGRYHSLLVDAHELPADLEVSAWSADGEIMGLRHKTLRLEGVQFHPESILTPDGTRLLANFLTQYQTPA